MAVLSPPEGLALHLLDLGGLRGDEANFIAGAGAATVTNPSPTHRWRELRMIAGLVEHPDAGLLLYEVGGPPDADRDWTGALAEEFPLFREEQHRLDVALAAAGHALSDVAGIVIGHLHPDHAGGLEYFRGTDVPIYVHEEELRSAFYGAATGESGSYRYLDFGFNWTPVHGPRVELFRGLELLHTPGHTAGLTGLLVDLPGEAPVYFASDQLIFAENLAGAPQGALARDIQAWHRSTRSIQRLVASRGARVVFGHDPTVFEAFPAVAVG